MKRVRVYFEYYILWTEFEMSDEEKLDQCDPEQLSSLHAPADDNDGLDISSDQPVQVAAVMHGPLFDFHHSILRLGGNTASMFRVLGGIPCPKCALPTLLMIHNMLYHAEMKLVK